MFERYTEKARRVVFYARFEASRFGNPKIEPEHLLLGLVYEAPELVNRFLTTETSEADLRERITTHTEVREMLPTSLDLPFSKSGKRVLTYAAEEADQIGHSLIGPEHLFLALLREESCLAARLLRECGAETEQVRNVLAASPEPGFHDPDPDGNARFQEVMEAWAPSSAASIAAVRTSAEQARPGATSAPYSDEARKAIFFAREEAFEMGSPYIETEHLLLGLMRDNDPIFARFLAASDATERLRKRIGATAMRGEKILESQDLPLSNECKRVLAYSAEEAERTAYPLIEGMYCWGLCAKETAWRPGCCARPVPIFSGFVRGWWMTCGVVRPRTGEIGGPILQHNR